MKTLPSSSLAALASLTLFAMACHGPGPAPANDEPSDAGRTARRKVPNVMLVVDKSFSMNLPADPSDPDCKRDGERCGTNTTNLCDITPDSSGRPKCPTRWTELQTAMNKFLPDAGAIASLGMTLFPENGDTHVCGGASRALFAISESDVDAVQNAQAQAIKSAIQNVTQNGVGPNRPNGGTPAASTLQTMLSERSLEDPERDNFVLLLTDGVPNCNDQFPDPYPSASCTCAVTSCVGPNSRKGCLDKDNVTQQIQALRAKGIKTIVVGFGAETSSGLGRDVLNAMAAEGGFARACPSGQSSECGSHGTCDAATQLCQNRFYQANDASELSAALAEIAKGWAPRDASADGGQP
jgi:hypothetical protein